MTLGRKEQEEEDFAYTPFKTFNRRRNFLVWLFNDKFDYLWTEEERQQRNEAESLVFKTSVGMKMLSLVLFMHLRFYKRPVGRPFAFDFALIYFGTYAFLGSNVPGVYLAWPLYQDQVKKLLESDKLRKRGLRNTLEFLDETRDLDFYKSHYYMYDMEFARYY